MERNALRPLLGRTETIAIDGDRPARDAWLHFECRHRGRMNPALQDRRGHVGANSFARNKAGAGL